MFMRFPERPLLEPGKTAEGKRIWIEKGLELAGFLQEKAGEDTVTSQQPMGCFPGTGVGTLCLVRRRPLQQGLASSAPVVFHPVVASF